MPGWKGETLSMRPKEYRPYAPDQLLLLPPSLRDWLAEDHLAYFISDLVDRLDLRAIEAAYEDELRGGPPYHPAMMVKVWLYAVCTGVYASRRVARRLQEDVAFRVLAAGNGPDFRTLSDFRKRHLAALARLFEHVLKVAQKAGLVTLGHVALDGTKIQANASKHKAMSYRRMKQEEARLAAEAAALLQRAEEADAADDARYGPDVSGDDVPEALRRREDRLHKIREAMAALEAEARERAEAIRTERKATGRSSGPPRATPREGEQYNFTDPDSHIMKMTDGAFAQAYNVQVAVDRRHQIIVATTVTAQAADAPHLPGMIEILRSTLDLPGRLTADAGYFSEANVQALADAPIEALIPPDKLTHNAPSPRAPRGRIPTACSPRDRMRRKLQTQAGRRVYRMHKAIAEPVLGQIKAARGFRRFLLRGLGNVMGEWRLVALAHNICKLFREQDRVRRALAMG